MSAKLDTLREGLERLGYEASTAASVEQAIVAMARVRPHVVLVDLIMPGISGRRRLRHRRKAGRPQCLEGPALVPPQSPSASAWLDGVTPDVLDARSATCDRRCRLSGEVALRRARAWAIRVT